jgi:F-box protein 11
MFVHKRLACSGLLLASAGCFLMAPPTVAGSAPAPLIVAKQGRASYRSIAEAVKRAPRGARILVRPGVYQEAVSIERPVEIVGDGEAADIVIDGADGSCITLAGERALVRNLTLRGHTSS